MVATLSFSFAASLAILALLVCERQCVDRWMEGDDWWEFHCPERLQLKLAETGLKYHLVITLNQLPLSLHDTRDFPVHLEHHPELSPARNCTCTQTPRHPTLLFVCALPVSLTFSSHDSTAESNMSIAAVLSSAHTMLLELNMNDGERCESVTILVQHMRMEDSADTVEGRLLTDRK
ncbi:hypothetical protein BLNAU_7461 [Blattamonas nauphoetae]|uniref:Uncharacterized protein n=1 Tax=Blattamonas nauphoetae TaxID=2049346 RepID=A0ABQ9Y1E4_9EUKA|nr:hypothetical protein BLNAU_7461 [Blattamonas nauphoetae]